jgi:carbonic anhydrase
MRRNGVARIAAEIARHRANLGQAVAQSPPPMDRYKQLLRNNQAWFRQKLEVDESYFRRQAEGQHPPFLWIGCADSRVVPDEITGSRPGDLFVHRNIANIVTHSDLNLMSLLEFGVLELRVDHIIVCGHTHCGGIQAALEHRKIGILDKWVRNIKDVYHLHRDELEALGDEAAISERLVELNVREQLANLAKTSFVQRRWHDSEFPILHGWVYHVESGRLDAIARTTREDPMDRIYRYEFDDDA